MDKLRKGRKRGLLIDRLIQRCGSDLPVGEDVEHRSITGQGVNAGRLDDLRQGTKVLLSLPPRNKTQEQLPMIVSAWSL